MVELWRWRSAFVFFILSKRFRYSVNMFFIDGWVCINDAWLGPRPVPYIYIWYKASKVGEVSVV